MVKKSGPNINSDMPKNEAVREYVKANPDQRVDDVIEGLKGFGISVSTATVSNVRRELGVASTRGRRAGQQSGAGTTRQRRGSFNLLLGGLDGKYMALAGQYLQGVRSQGGTPEDAIRAVQAVQQLGELMSPVGTTVSTGNS